MALARTHLLHPCCPQEAGRFDEVETVASQAPSHRAEHSLPRITAAAGLQMTDILAAWGGNCSDVGVSTDSSRTSGTI
ncbi:Uncharacterised protein [Mycobacteroides abscessus subsp. bolletii]|uniref:hypothetical protein n=1 Tax=Mycobacteroides abscessus TaxID=36809 RepID=UPI0009A66BDE|nr:hypothetical protein [Mycobacteroides abscessus]SKG70987.1 Uncharacterised protein [Mycobacteroides abscessus subsp. bolletii]SKH11558.1 Uncharacterised protein [Mycobacteroides abscessus subsp. bolletii]